MSQIKQLFQRYVRLMEEDNNHKEAMKEDKKTLDEELKEIGVTGARKKAFTILVKEEIRTNSQAAAAEEVQQELDHIRSEVHSS